LTFFNHYSWFKANLRWLDQLTLICIRIRIQMNLINKMLIWWKRILAGRLHIHQWQVQVTKYNILTLLSRETESETEPLYSSGYFMASVCIKLTAAVTTPCTHSSHTTTWKSTVGTIENHGNRGNRDFRQMPWFSQNTVFAVFWAKMPCFCILCNTIFVLNQRSWSLCDFNTKMFNLCLYTTKVNELCYRDVTVQMCILPFFWS